MNHIRKVNYFQSKYQITTRWTKSICNLQKRLSITTSIGRFASNFIYFYTKKDKSKFKHFATKKGNAKVFFWYINSFNLLCKRELIMYTKLFLLFYCFVLLNAYKHLFWKSKVMLFWRERSNGNKSKLYTLFFRLKLLF